ncbi:hypothetical protein DFP72DRAFT_924130 [Ephemerocybe angulata]|uniref:SnoaL-like domain-containing protein n=1 Tax=Ephemerocybe angulata TaxID=980116 RepID=A0A8H6HGL5_9AGAR|nr:hypothetical protein DFP72DRAFT_924130 [Tulosesus angulatus]
MNFLLQAFVAFALPLLFITEGIVPAVALPVLDSPTAACDYNAKGPLLRLRREAAVRDFARLYLVEKQARKAFDKWIPGEYIQHNPDAVSGREVAIAYVEQLQTTPGMVYQNITSFSGEGFGLFHFRRRVPGTEVDFAIMDKLGFKGTCFNEHWDVRQRITGNETNPIAYF